MNHLRLVRLGQQDTLFTGLVSLLMRRLPVSHSHQFALIELMAMHQYQIAAFRIN